MSVLVKEKGKIIPTISSGLFEQTKFYGDNYSTYEAGVEPEARMPLANVTEGPANYTIAVAVPGIEKTDINISVMNGTLSVSCEKETEEQRDEKETFRRKEFSYTSFKRSFTLPEEVSTEKITASYTDGVLTILVPKNEVSSTMPVTEISVR